MSLIIIAIGRIFNALEICYSKKDREMNRYSFPVGWEKINVELLGFMIRVLLQLVGGT